MPHLEEMAAPISNEAVVAGVTYKFTVLSLMDYAAAAKEMKRKQQQPHEIIKQIGPDLPPDMQAALLEMAYRDERTGRDISIEDIDRSGIAEVTVRAHDTLRLEWKFLEEVFHGPDLP